MDLTVIEENIKTHPKPNPEKPNKKNLKNPRRLHNGGHEWDDCRQNPKNQKSVDKKNTENNHSRGGNGNSNCQCQEHRCTERDRQSSRERSHHCSRSSSSHSSSSHEYNAIQKNQEKEEKTQVPSSEILFAMPAKKGSKKYTTYLELINLGDSGSLVNKELVELADFDIKLQNTATGVFQTDGSVIIENYCLP